MHWVQDALREGYIDKYSSSTTHVRFELDLTRTLPVLIRVSSTDHVGIKSRSSLDRDWFIRLMCPYNHWTHFPLSIGVWLGNLGSRKFSTDLIQDRCTKFYPGT